MPKALSEDLRWRIVWQCCYQGEQAEQVARNLCVGKKFNGLPTCLTEQEVFSWQLKVMVQPGTGSNHFTIKSQKLTQTSGMLLESMLTACEVLHPSTTASTLQVGEYLQFLLFQPQGVEDVYLAEYVHSVILL